jgi:hypothetical protein
MSANDEHRVTDGPYGFAWGPMEVRRVAEVSGSVALDITTDTGKRVTVYVSPTGRSLRVFGDGGEWKPGGAA